ncbi:hypothetical protein N9V67_04290 [Amylibacter sp.]|nr:hypothetical protein [Amylibacter sp.]MDB2537311.1 hypothetical protein [Amylibacter sp.]MDC1041464.1 hypothetical protein [Amylibacter sp.]
MDFLNRSLFSMNPIISGAISFLVIWTSPQNNIVNSSYALFAVAQISAGLIGGLFAFSKFKNEGNSQNKLVLDTAILISLTILVVSILVASISGSMNQSPIFVIALIMLSNIIFSILIINMIFEGKGLIAIYMSLLPGIFLIIINTAPFRFSVSTELIFTIVIIISSILLFAYSVLQKNKNGNAIQIRALSTKRLILGFLVSGFTALYSYGTLTIFENTEDWKLLITADKVFFTLLTGAVSPYTNKGFLIKNTNEMQENIKKIVLAIAFMYVCLAIILYILGIINTDAVIILCMLTPQAIITIMNSIKIRYLQYNDFKSEKSTLVLFVVPALLVIVLINLNLIAELKATLLLLVLLSFTYLLHKVCPVSHDA